MALFMLRRWFSFASASLRGRVVLTRSTRAKLPPPSPAAAAARTYSSEQGPEIKAMLNEREAAPGPVFWVRTRVYYLMIKLFFDEDFKSKRFIEAAKQLFSHVSRLLSEGQFDALEGLVTDELRGAMQEKYKDWPLHETQTFAADHIISAKPNNVKIYTASGRWFVDIQMLFYYLSAYDPEKHTQETHVFQIPGKDGSGIKTLRSALYTFRMERDKYIPPGWIITMVDHGYKSET